MLIILQFIEGCDLLAVFFFPFIRFILYITWFTHGCLSSLFIFYAWLFYTQMFKYLGVFCMCFLLSGVRGNFLDDLKHFGDQALHSALDSLSTDGVKTLVSTAVSAAGTGEQIIPTTII